MPLIRRAGHRRQGSSKADGGQRERLQLGNFPTRITRASELGAELGVDLWIKHEFEADAFGAGNKIRKLEYLLPEILRGGNDGLVVDGTTQSNCAIALALYAPRFNLTVDLVLYGSTEPVGNFADIRRSGASVTILPEWSPREIQRAENNIVDQGGARGPPPICRADGRHQRHYGLWGSRCGARAC